MTFGARTSIGMNSANGAITTPSVIRTNTSVSTGTRSTFVNCQSTGLIAVGAGNGAASAAWVTPAPTTGIGSSWWVKFHLTSSANTNSPPGVISGVTMDTWLPLSAGQLINFNSGGSNNEYTAGVSLQFATDAGGSNVVGSGGISVDIGYAP